MSQKRFPEKKRIIHEPVLWKMEIPSNLSEFIPWVPDIFFTSTTDPEENINSDVIENGYREINKVLFLVFLNFTIFRVLNMGL